MTAEDLFGPVVQLGWETEVDPLETLDMSRVIIGIVTGAFVAGLAVFLWSESQESQPRDSELSRSVPTAVQIEPAAGPTDLADPTDGQNLADTNVVNVVDESVGQYLRPRDYTMDSVRDLTLEQLLAERDAATSLQGGMLFEWERRRRERVEKWASVPPPSNPIFLPPELYWVADEALDSFESMQREPDDPNWSSVTETQFATFFASNPDLLATYGTPAVDCRTSGCTIAVVAYGVPEFSASGNGETLQVDEEFKSAISGLLDQEWIEQLNTSIGVPPSQIRSENGATTFFLSWPRSDD